MPVECRVEIAPMDQERFHAVDRAVMGHAFDIHNTLGRFCDERIYQEELAGRCRSHGFEVDREVQVRDYLESYETHLRRLLCHTRLDRIHWLNLDGHTVTLRTLYP